MTGNNQPKQPRGSGREASLMDDIPPGMSGLQRAIALQQQAARVGFDWLRPEPILEKLEEERQELAQAMASADPVQIADELGDVLFVLTNLARRLGIDPVLALHGANAKFERRFRMMEQQAGRREVLQDMSLEDMEVLWQQVKVQLRQAEDHE